MEMHEFDAEEVAFNAEAQPLNIQVAVLPELTPASPANELLWYDGRRVAVAWNTDSGAALVKFWYVVALRHGLPRRSITGAVGLSVFQNSDMIEQRSSWMDNSLDTSDSFSLVHWAVRFEKNETYEQDRIFECAASPEIDYVHLPGESSSALLAAWLD